jgi:hypothetical protein
MAGCRRDSTVIALPQPLLLLLLLIQVDDVLNEGSSPTCLHSTTTQPRPNHDRDYAWHDVADDNNVQIRVCYTCAKKVKEYQLSHDEDGDPVNAPL